MSTMPANNIISAKAKLCSMVLAISLPLALPITFAADACIQAPKRATPCPHQIYKLMKLKPTEKAKVTCVCITDFKQFLVEPKNDVERQLRKLELKGLAADLQLTEQQVANLAKR